MMDNARALPTCPQHKSSNRQLYLRPDIRNATTEGDHEVMWATRAIKLPSPVRCRRISSAIRWLGPGAGGQHQGQRNQYSAPTGRRH